MRPPAPPAASLQLSLPLLPLAAPVSSLRLSSAALPPARPGANPPARIGVFSPGSTGGKHPIFTACYALPVDWRLTFQLALASLLQLGLRSLPTHTWRRPSARFLSDRRLHRLPPLPTPAACLRLASAVTPSGFAGFAAPGSRRAPLPPVGPAMHPLPPSNLASPAEPSMSIPLWPDLASSGSASLNNSDRRRFIAISGAASDPSQAFAQGFTLWLGWRTNFRLSSVSFRQPFRRSTPDALWAIS